MNRIHKLAIPVLLLMMCVALGASAQSTAIKAEDGGGLPDNIPVGETFTVLITEDGSPVGAGTRVTFTLPQVGGIPIFAYTDATGKVRYKPLITGTLGIKMLDGTHTVAEATVNVTDAAPPSGGGTLTPADAVIALEIAVGSRPCDLHWDVSGDGRVTSLDALMILQSAAGAIEL